MKTMEERRYPYSCQSQQCGRIECSGCPNQKTLLDFKAWRDQHAAVQTDPIWAAPYWIATR